MHWPLFVAYLVCDLSEASLVEVAWGYNLLHCLNVSQELLICVVWLCYGGEVVSVSRQTFRRRVLGKTLRDGVQRLSYHTHFHRPQGPLWCLSWAVPTESGFDRSCGNWLEGRGRRPGSSNYRRCLIVDHIFDEVHFLLVGHRQTHRDILLLNTCDVIVVLFVVHV